MSIYNTNTSPNQRLYLDEMFYHAPLLIAQQLQKNKQYEEALDWFRKIYDYGTGVHGQAKFNFTLLEASTASSAYQYKITDYLSDPINPHGIAINRQGTYKDFLILSVVRCLLDYADAEFTIDSPESLPRARELYLKALQLLEEPALTQTLKDCEGSIADIEKTVNEGWGIDIEYSAIQPEEVISFGTFMKTLSAADKKALATLKTDSQKLETVRTLFLQRLGEENAAVLTERNLENAQIEYAPNYKAIEKTGIWNGSGVTMQSEELETTTISYYIPNISANYCVSPNPVVRMLRLRAELNLYKLRTCRNIAGMKRELDFYAAATDQTTGLPVIGAGGQVVMPGVPGNIRPTIYRYPVLVQRARDLVQLAQQVESSFLAALEKRDNEVYSLLRARQDIQLKNAQVKLRNLQVKQAQDGVKLSELQKERYQIQAEEYEKWLEQGMIDLENQLIDIFGQLEVAQQVATISGGVAQGISGVAGIVGGGSTLFEKAVRVGLSIAYGAAVGIQTAAQVAANSIQRNINQINVKIGFEYRKREWEFQKKLSDQDIRIADQQINISKDNVQITEQERTIAEMDRQYSNDVLEFLNTKFTNRELYDWMAGVLEGVYSFFLQEATAVAKTAYNQLAFERQETPPDTIKSDYWITGSEEGIPGASPENTTSPDRKGLTGSARLLQDVIRIDQYAFDTNKRKQQISKTISLAELDPFAFQQFKETGLLSFKTTMEEFDRDFPGQYMRLIRRVRVSVVALIPPSQGIKAMLTAAGVSRVVIGGDVFQTVPIRREPEMVSISAPYNATGLFELEQQPNDLLYPFEGSGVASSWEFRMPRASNPFDFNTIADILFTIEYTALHSFDYQQQVIQQLGSKGSGERLFDMRMQFPDQWYDLNNAALVDESKQMKVLLPITRQDFPVNLNDIKIEQVLIYVSRREGSTFELGLNLRMLAPDENNATNNAPGGITQTVEGIVSTRRPNGMKWNSLVGRSPEGNWYFDLSGNLNDGRPIREAFENNEIQDIILVISYSGRLPEWLV